MLRSIVQKVFDVREGEFRITLWMNVYIFLVITVLLIIKPTVNALFLSELGIERLPFAFVLVAVTALLSSYYYTRALSQFTLSRIIRVTLLSSVVILIGTGLLLSFGMLSGWLLYFFYIWVSLYALLSASQFWVLANLVFNIREAKRLFGFIGSGAIAGGIFGGYLTSILTPLIGNEGLLFIAAFLLLPCHTLLIRIWNLRVRKLTTYTQHKRLQYPAVRPFELIRKSRHLTFIACIVALSVLVAKLVDYLFSDFASAAISDPEALATFFAFWFSTFNLLSLGVQLFFTHRIVGIWGVGFSLLVLPMGILGGSVLFFILPELSSVVMIKAMDGILKQSVHKSATELLSLPLPFELKKRTKSFIDVVIDSVATGIAGCLLIFVVQGLHLASYTITALVIGLVGLWVYFIFQVRKEYFRTFRSNLQLITEKGERRNRGMPAIASVIKGMRTVFDTGSEEQILFMLRKLMEINDKRFLEQVQQLLRHPSLKVRTAAIQNLYFLNSSTMVSEVPALLSSGDDELTLATLEYLLLHAEKESALVYDAYLNHPNSHISDMALYCLARETRDNQKLKLAYDLRGHIALRLEEPTGNPEQRKRLLRIIGNADLPEFYPLLTETFKEEDAELVKVAIEAAGYSMQPDFLPALLNFLPQKKYRASSIAALLQYGNTVLPHLGKVVRERELPLAHCRIIPQAIKAFKSQQAVHTLFGMLDDQDLGIRLEVIRALSDMRKLHPEYKFSEYRVVSVIYEECRLHHDTLAAMQTQILISYRNRRRSGEVSEAEREARTSLLEILERRLDSGLERIFILLGLKYPQQDVEIAYQGITSNKQGARTQAIEFLDTLLTGDLKRRLLPLIEESSIDTGSAEMLQKIKRKIPTEKECFALLLQGNDLKVKLAVLFLIRQQGDAGYLPLILPYLQNEDIKLRTFAKEAAEALGHEITAS